MKRFLILVLLVVMLALAACNGTPTPTEPTPTTSPLATPPTSPLVTPRVKDAGALVVGKSLDQMEENQMDVVLQWLLDFCFSASLQIVIGLCALDLAFGIGAALRTGEFDWKRVGDFYKSQILALLVPYIATLAVLVLVPGLVDWLPVAVAPAGMLTGITGKLVGSLIANFQKLGLGSS